MSPRRVGRASELRSTFEPMGPCPSRPGSVSPLRTVIDSTRHSVRRTHLRDVVSLASGRRERAGAEPSAAFSFSPRVDATELPSRRRFVTLDVVITNPMPS